MKKQRVVRGIPVEAGSGNVYADLGYPDSESMLVKAQLAAKIAEIVQRRALTQTRTAEILGLTQPKVSALLKGQFRGISEHRLLECLTRLGRDVHIVIKPAPKSRSNGRLTLSVAGDEIALDVAGLWPVVHGAAGRPTGAATSIFG
jgi:predicted XRE-type DNA-binding protein